MSSSFQTFFEHIFRERRPFRAIPKIILMPGAWPQYSTMQLGLYADVAFFVRTFKL